METLIIVFIFGLVCVVMGWKAREYQAMKAISKAVDEITENTIEEFRSKVVNIRVEDHDGQFFVYAKDDGSYLAHAKTKTVLEDILVEKFPGKLFNASPEDLEKLESR
jgi:phosphatidylserine decarboxylase